MQQRSPVWEKILPPLGTAVAPGARPWRRRLAAELPAKVALLLGLSVGICVPYYFLQRHQWFPSRSVPTTPLDGWVVFDPAWVYVYGSIALLVPLLPLLARRRRDLDRYARGLALLCALSFTAFLLFPVAGPRPPGLAGHGAYAALVSVDRSFNSMPSLHAGLTAYSFLFGWRALREALHGRAAVAYAGLALGWSASILYATLATKQHWALDLPPGILLAWLAHRWAWRDAGSEPVSRPSRRRDADPSPPAA